MAEPASEQHDEQAADFTSQGGRFDVTQDFQADAAHATRLVEVLDQYLLDLKAGRKPDRAKLLEANPELASQLEACLAGVEFIHAGSEPAARKRLGDFRILREVGHGGMGAVYEAEQISLGGRRVALKVLRFGRVSDPEAIQRFQREAETVARLHHTNIVPIFAVGSEHGVNYYAMQFIVGRSLDQVLKQRGGAIDSRTVAEWGLQAAEALAHAHARDVIHRDVKPSNLLIDDDEGRIWLTDFGLAKRLDDVTLSMTGALLGTPRYMSPEQASAAHHMVDHRTDIYSLGASLYELATGKPVFTGDAPHNVISQILTVDPQPPRSHLPSLPRDLDTILMKCLAKDPAARYSSARQLADDLRAFLEGRPISARRTSFVELAGRWLQRQKRSVAQMSAAVAATLALVLVGVFSGYYWHRARLATLMLKTDHPPLVAELLDDQGELVVPRMTVPTLQRVEVPRGEYSLRLSGAQRLSQTYDIHLAGRDGRYRKLDLEDQLLWRDMKVAPAYRLARFDQPSVKETEDLRFLSRTDVIRLTDEGIQCAAGNNGLDRWLLKLASPEKALLKEGVRLLWPWHMFGSGFNVGLGKFDGRPFIVSAQDTDSKSSLDFNGDGTSDLVLAARHQPWLLAISGRDGEPLWIVARGATAGPEERDRTLGVRGAVLYPPTIVDDQNGDGVAELAAMFIDVKPDGPAVERWLELVSGRDGTTVWRYDLAAEFFQLPQGEEVPYELRWFYGYGGGYSSGSSGGSASDWNFRVRGLGDPERSGEHQYMPSRPVPLRALPGTESPARLNFMAGRHVLQIDPGTGKASVPPQDTGVRAGIEPRYGDFDGDGQVDLLLIEQLADKIVPPASGSSGGNVSQARLAAWSAAKKSLLWELVIEAAMPRQREIQLPQPLWPVVIDLDGDHVSEVLVPDGSTAGVSYWNAPPWGKIAVLEGRTGQPRWRRQIMNMDQQIDCFIVGPDINGDKIREVYVAALWGGQCDLFVDCLSGSTGEPLWQTPQSLFHRESESGDFQLANLSWYEGGGDGWPQLVVPAREDQGDLPDRVCFFSAGTGKLLHMAPDVSDVEPADLDADGVEDLVLFRRAAENNWGSGGTLQGYRGVGREAWRGTIEQQTVAGDLNGDGIGDLVDSTLSRGKFKAHSGATGKTLWQASVETQMNWNSSVQPAAEPDPQRGAPAKPHDLNGDAAPDLLALPGTITQMQPQPLLLAFSGRTGRQLWAAGIRVQVIGGFPLLECRDLDGDGQSEVIIAAAIDYLVPARGSFGSQDARLWLAVLSGDDGSVRWAEPLVAAGQSAYDIRQIWLEAAYGDLNGDKVLDILLPAQASPSSTLLEMRGISGSDGKPLWGHPLPPQTDVQESFGDAPPAVVGDVDGDGKPEVAVVSLADGSDGPGQATFVQLALLEGDTGKQRWTWRARTDRWANEINNQKDRVKHRLRPLLVRRADGKHWIALRTWHNASEIHVLNDGGQLVSKISHKSTGNYAHSRLWPIDADGDGGDELLMLAEEGLSLLSPDKLDQPLWRRTPQEFPVSSIQAILPDPATPGRIVVLGGYKDNSLRGLDPSNGRCVWHCVGPASDLPYPAGDQVAMLNSPQPNLPPHAFYKFGYVTSVRSGVNREDRETWRSYGQAAPARQGASHDPRLLRPLPWKFSEAEAVEVPRFLVWSCFYGITLIAIPVGYVGWLIRWRQWGLKTWLLLPVVAGIFLLGATITGPDGDFRSLGRKLIVGVFLAGPWMFAATMLAWWSWQKRWGVVLAWISAGPPIAVAMAAFMLFVVAPNETAPLQPSELWSWDQWYWIFLPAYATVAGLMLVGVPAWWLIKFTWRWAQGLRRPEAALKA